MTSKTNSFIVISDSVNDIIQNFERLLDDLRPLNSSLSNLSKQLETFPNSSWIKDVEAANKSLNVRKYILNIYINKIFSSYNVDAFTNFRRLLIQILLQKTI